jgi:hypothetical protein
MKRKTCDIRTWKKHLLLGISSTNTDTLVPSLYLCVETRSKEVFLTVVSATSAPPFQPLRHQRIKQMEVARGQVRAVRSSQ